MSSQTGVQTLPPAASRTGPGDAGGLSEGQKRGLLIGGGVFIVLAIAALIVAAIYLGRRPELAASVRDVFIIFMAFEFMIIGVALVVLIFQLAVLTNMLQHEIRPILDSTNETVNTVRGTTTFISENLVEPIVKLNTYVAAIAQVVDSLGALGRFGRRQK